MTEETTGRRDPFFAFDDETDERPEEPEEGRRGRAVAWKPIGVGLLGLLLGLVLAVSGALTWDGLHAFAVPVPAAPRHVSSAI